MRFFATGVCGQQSPILSCSIACCVRILGETSGGVHGVPQAASGDASTDHGVLRAPLPGQVLRRGADPGRAEREAPGGRHQLQLPITCRFSAILCQRRLKLRVRRCDQTTLRSLPTW